MAERKCQSGRPSDEQAGAGRKWCPFCECWFTPRPCNAKRQRHCCRTATCRLASKRESNRLYHRKMSADPEWRQANVLRVQRNRRIQRDGFDGESVGGAVDDFFGSLSELLDQVSTTLRLLESYRLLLPAVLVQKLSSSPVTAAIDLQLARNRTVCRSEKAALSLKTVPALTLRDHGLACCA